ncbi:dienelactone hydrolase family protein [Elioraea thermophila]|uniref:dienelactone hydrolase family protein n=1 Tax=Elioraea thermophila TaxID=2185104 RepID=UPI000DF2D10A|nr:dienelactone hydrolase family protein [Elioraea thermophila]
MSMLEPLSVRAEDGVVLAGELHLPPSPPPWPAMLFIHGSGGLLRWHRRYAALLRSEGVAVAMLDHFGPRGIRRTVHDQERLTSEHMARDAHAALAVLAADPRLDPGRIGVLGLSKGGSAAWRAALRRFAGSRAFALHLALYPGCETRYADMTTTGAPIVILVGLADTYTCPHACFDLVPHLRAGGSPVEIYGLPGAPHGWDSGAGRWQDPKGVSYAPCRFVEIAPGLWREEGSGETWRAGDADGRRRAVARCRRLGVAGGGCAESTRLSDGILRAAVRRALLGGREAGARSPRAVSAL